MSETIRAVVFQRGEWWIAQCLEFGLATQARNLADLPQELERLLKVQVEASLERGIKPFEGVPPAPKRYWEMFDRSQTLLVPLTHLADPPNVVTRLAA